MIRRAIIFIPVMGLLKLSAVSMLKSIDLAICRTFSRYLPGRSSLSCFLFHGLYPDEKAKKANLVDPQQFISTEGFEKFIKYYLSKGYLFVSPQDVLSGLAPDKKYALITFDDGYFNNQYALPILKKYKVPAVFCISTANVLENKSFWWDCLYRERMQRKTWPAQLELERRELKLMKAIDIEKYILEKFGKDSLVPQSDLDRPFTPSELKAFAQESYVHLGNHTHEHAILSNYSALEARSQIHNAQQAIAGLIGKSPDVLSYPNGAYSGELAKITKEVGIGLAVTNEPKKNYFPINSKKPEQSILLGRFILKGDGEIAGQCEIFHSDFSLYLRSKKFVADLLKFRTFVAF